MRLSEQRGGELWSFSFDRFHPLTTHPHHLRQEHVVMAIHLAYGWMTYLTIYVLFLVFRQAYNMRR